MAEERLTRDIADMNAKLAQSQGHVATLSQTVDTLNAQIVTIRADFNMALETLRTQVAQRPADSCFTSAKPMQLIDMKNFQLGSFSGIAAESRHSRVDPVIGIGISRVLSWIPICMTGLLRRKRRIFRLLQSSKLGLR